MDIDTLQEPGGLVLSDLRRMGRLSVRNRTRLKQFIAQAVLEELPQGVIAFTSDHKFIFQNVESERIFRSVPEAFTEWVESMPTSLHSRSRLYELFESALQGKPAKARRMRLVTTRDTLNFSVLVRPIHGAKGTTVGALLSFFNIDPQIRRENLLTAARDKAEQAGEAKVQFVANLSHEIRTPLSAIMGYADTLFEAKNDPAEVDRRIQIIRSNCVSLLTLVDDILDVARLESSKMRPSFEEVGIERLLSELHALLIVRAKLKGLTLNFHADTPFPSSFGTDPVRVRQILVNLLGNAIKFTEKGSVELRLSMDRGQGLLHIDVIDSGPGIRDEDHKRIFELFQQGDNSNTRAHAGSGLGLALSQRLALLLNGSLSLVSSTSSGSCFRLTLPASVEGEFKERLVLSLDSLHEQEKWTSLNGVKILLVEDSDDNRELFRVFLEGAEAQVLCANNGESAVEMALEHGPDIVLMDIQMPVMDGYQAVRLLRDRKFEGALVALTAHAMKDEVKRCEQAGFDAHISKPVSASRLTATISDILGLEQRLLLDEKKLNLASARVIDICRRALPSILRSLEQMRVSAVTESWQDVGKEAHKVKGLSASCGFRELSELAGDLENAAKGSPRSETIYEIFYKMESSWNRTNKEFSRFLGE